MTVSSLHLGMWKLLEYEVSWKCSIYYLLSHTLKVNIRPIMSTCKLITKTVQSLAQTLLLHPNYMQNGKIILL